MTLRLPPGDDALFLCFQRRREKGVQKKNPNHRGIGTDELRLREDGAGASAGLHSPLRNSLCSVYE